MSAGDKPFIGARGPRKTKPRDSKAAKAARAAVDNVVTELFPDERKEATSIKSPTGERNRKRKKVRVGQGWSRALEYMEAHDMDWKGFVATLSPEELARGQLKNKNGTFAGAPPQWVPAEFHKECIRELMRRGKQRYQENYLAAIDAMTLIATNVAVEPKDRIRAAQFVIERIEGKVPERLEVGVSEPWQEILTGIVATLPADGTAVPVRPFHEAIEGGVVGAASDAEG